MLASVSFSVGQTVEFYLFVIKTITITFIMCISTPFSRSYCMPPIFLNFVGFFVSRSSKWNLFESLSSLVAWHKWIEENPPIKLLLKQYPYLLLTRVAEMAPQTFDRLSYIMTDKKKKSKNRYTVRQQDEQIRRCSGERLEKMNATNTI